MPAPPFDPCCIVHACLRARRRLVGARRTRRQPQVSAAAAATEDAQQPLSFTGKRSLDRALTSNTFQNARIPVFWSSLLHHIFFGTIHSIFECTELLHQRENMTSHQAMATGLIAGAVATVAAAAFVLIRKDNLDERLKSVSVSVAGSTLASRPADEPRRRSRFRRHQVDEAAVVGCASRSEFCSCIDHYLDEKDTVIMIRGTTDGTPNKEDGGDGAGESRTVQVVGANRVRIFEGDVWDIHALLALVAQLPGGIVTAVCMETSNIFGNDILCDTLALIRMLRAVLAPHIKMILIRSRAIFSRSASLWELSSVRKFWWASASWFTSLSF